ncbi:Hypothetical predicted protein, partial [Pelobates cultripes]
MGLPESCSGVPAFGVWQQKAVGGAEAWVGWGVEAEDLTWRTEPVGGIQHVGPPESYFGVPAFGNRKRSEDHFPVATNGRKVKGAKPPGK